MSPSPREGRAGGGSGSTAIELSELRQDRSADFSPLPAVLAGPERGGLKSALLNSMAVGSGRGDFKRARQFDGTSPAFSPLVPSRERGHFSDGGCIQMRPRGYALSFWPGFL